MKALLIITAIVLAGCFSSQNFQKGISAEATIPKHTVKVKNDQFFTSSFTNNVPARVMADFLERFGDVSNVSWYVEDRKVTAHFIENNEQVTVQYQPDGLHLQTRKTYDGSQLDSRVSQLLQNELGKKFTLNLVTEVIKEAHVLYEVSLFSKTQVHFVQVYKNPSDETLSVVGRTLIKRG